MIYLALLRGINVGGKHKVEMARLRATFEKLGFTDVKTYINSGNVIFETAPSDKTKLTKRIERAIAKKFGFDVPTLLRSQPEMEALMGALPKDWLNDEKTKCDVLFLWDAVNSPDAVNQVTIKPDIEELVYAPGALMWRVDRAHITRGSIVKIIGTDFYKQVTIRNPNTVRRLYDLMQASADKL